MFTQQKKIQKPSYYKRLVALSSELSERKKQLDERLKSNFATREKFVVVCGPCSADNPVAMAEYLTQLKQHADTCKHLLVVARVYTSKPHSNGVGYKGSAFHLLQNEPVDLDAGIIRCRRMMIRCIEEGLPVADELLYPELYECFDDLVSYWFVGARSSEDNFHRDFASGLDVCCGVKNGTDGDIEKAVDSLYAVTSSGVFPYKGVQIVTSGCKYAHIVLRGGYREGGFLCNISQKQITFAKELLRQKGLSDFVMADLNHANSKKTASKQPYNAEMALQGGADGVMIESYLRSGGQSVQYGTSQTDDCLDIGATKELLDSLDIGFDKLHT